MKIGAIVAVALFGLLPSIVGAAPKTAIDEATGTINDARWRSGLPLGGIGCGKIELLTDGGFGNFTINHNWDRPYGFAKGAFAAIRVKGAGDPVAKLLRLPSANEYAGVDDIAHASAHNLFPRGTITFTDTSLPVSVKLDAFSPLIPHDPKNSSLPVAILTYTVTNTSAAPVDTSVALAWPNLLGWGGKGNTSYDDLTGDAQQAATDGSLSGLRYTTTQAYTDERQDTVGEYYVAVRTSDDISESACDTWDTAADTPGFWQDFVTTGKLAPLLNGGVVADPAGAVAGSAAIAPGQTEQFEFVVCWMMPNHITSRQSTTYGPDTVTTSDGTSALFDKDKSTRWSTGRAMQKGDRLDIDLGRAVPLKNVVLDVGVSKTDYPHGLLVESSVDNVNFTAAANMSARDLAAQAASAGAINVPLLGRSIRYLRLTNQAADSFHWWSIYEFSAFSPGSVAPVDLAGAKASAVLLTQTQKEDVVNQGHYYQNFFQSATDIAQYADENATDLLAQTAAWQSPLLKSNLPDWMKLDLINSTFPIFSNTILTKDGKFAVQESPVDMGGALGTMDQRMAAHAYYTSFFPELDRAELELYAQCQQDDGRITHFDGNIHETVGDPNVGYGITDWPDLSCSWLLQVVKLYRWTGDAEFLSRMKPHIDSAMSFLASGDHQGDGIPEGGSTYDYESVPPGAFSYNASCYLGALRGAMAVSSPLQNAVYQKRLAKAQASVMSELWNGTFLRKWKSPNTGKTVENSFVAALAGDWLARLGGLPRTMDATIIHKEEGQLIARHQKSFFPVPPMEVTPDGKSATSACYMLQHEPYLGCEAIDEGYVSDGVETIKRVYDVAWLENQSPWNESLCYNAPDGAQGGLACYMTCPAAWHVLPALAGASLDLPDHRLYLSPRMPSYMTELHMPIYLSRFWGWIDYVPAAHTLTLRIDKVFGNDLTLAGGLYTYPTSAPRSSDSGATDMTVTSVAADGDAKPIMLAQPFAIKEGAVLDLSGQLKKLGLPISDLPSPPAIKHVAQRPGLPSANWTLSDSIHGDGEFSSFAGQAALDGDPATRWTTGRSMQPGDQIRLDMKCVNKVAKIVLDSAASPNDYPRGYILEGSTDGATWSKLASATPDDVQAAVKAGVLTITIPPTDARYLRITNQQSTNGLFWSIHELTVYGP